MLKIGATIAVDEAELVIKPVLASGPGGQNVNKTATAVQLRFDVAHSPSLPEAVRQRLARLAGRRMTTEGILIIEARQYRTQEQNRQAAIKRLAILIQHALQTPEERRATQPTQASRLRRLETKRRRSESKRLRRAVDAEE